MTETGSAKAQMIGTLLSGRYRLESRLGSGGMSTVYLARDETLDRSVAVKVMHREISEQPDQLERFRAEARAVAKLSHSNIVTVIDAGQDGGHPYIVFEYVEGETVKQRIRRAGPLPVSDALAYAIEIGQGLAVAHQRRLVHRDIKPQNVLIDPDGRAKVTDFGIARQLESEGVTASGRVLGTTDYVSPEQAMGHQVDPRSDIYSLGIVLYEMLVGDVPFHADSLVGVAMKHVNEDLPDVQRRRPEVSAAVASVIERATTKDPARRYQTIEQMIDDLEAALEVEAARAGSITGEATSVLEALPPAKRRLRGGGGVRNAVVVLLFAIAAALAVVAIIVSGDVGGGGGGAAAAGARIDAQARAAFDPEGDGEEHDDEIGLATDGQPLTTAWTTETYLSGPPLADKDGVGLYVDAGRPVRASEIEIRSAEGGWNAEIGAANAPPEEFSGWQLVGGAEDIGTRETIPIDTNRRRYRYYLIWITKLVEVSDGYRVEISDVRLFG